MTEIPPGIARSESGAESLGTLDAPVLIIQLQDDLARSRLREAFWISVVVHLLLVIALATTPKYLLGGGHVVAVRSAEDLLREQQLNFIELPPDEQKVTQRPKTNNISDKDRIATSRTPQIDRKTLDELRDARRPGPPSPPAGSPGPEQMSKAAPPQPAQGQPAQGEQAPPSPVPPQANSSSALTAQLQPPQKSLSRNAFGSGMASPGSVIEQAARAAAVSRGGGGGVAGDYGLGMGRGQGTIRGQLDILSDTMGVDFGPYLQRVLHDVRENWYQLIPEVARAPLMKRGKVAIEFAITRNGQVAGMRLVGPSGDVSLDRAAWGGISASNPFPPLPNEFRGSYLALRFHFFYNPDKHDLE